MTAPFPPGASDQAASSPDAPATGGLIADVLAGFSRLVRGEIDLAKAEAAGALKRAVRGAALMLGAVVFAVVALGLLAQAAVAALVAAGLSPAVACLALAAVLAVAALGFARLAAGHLDRAGRFSDRSARNLSRDLQSLRTGVNSHAGQ